MAILGPGTHAARPAAAPGNAGDFYLCTTHGEHERSDGAAWSSTGIPNRPPATSSGLSEAEAQALIDASISALVDAAPGALNTLNELAAALGDDPNAATTLTNLINAIDARVDDLEAAGTGMANPMTTGGDTIRGGGGVASNEVPVTSPLQNGASIILGGASAVNGDQGDHDQSSQTHRLDLGVGNARAVTKHRIYSWEQQPGTMTHHYVLQVSDAVGGPWVTVLERNDGPFGADSGDHVVPVPLVRRYVQLVNLVDGGGVYDLQEWSVWAATMTGAGNPTRVAPGAELSNWRIVNGIPVWAGAQAANADTAGATLANLEIEVNQLKAALRATGIIAP